MRRWRAIVLLLVAAAVVVMDGLTYGGLFKVPAWQWLRTFWAGGW